MLTLKVQFTKSNGTSEVVQVSDKRVIECLTDYFHAESVEIVAYEPDKVPPAEDA